MYRFVTPFIITALVSGVAFAEDVDLLFVLDASGSMRQVTAGETQIDSARKAIRSAIRSIPSSVHTGLRVYAHRVEQREKEKSCRDTELVVPIAQNRNNEIEDELSKIEPKGYTPISYSLEQVRGDFPVARESKKVVILLSDGEETCGGDPAATVTQLRKDGFDVTVHVIGFNVNDSAEEQLRAAAEAGSGHYFEASDGVALEKALEAATKEALVIEKSKSTYGSDIRGGDSFETAVEIEIGKEYRLDHHQKKGEYDYFYLDVKANDEIQAEIKTLEKGITIADGSITETNYPYAGVSLHRADRTRIRNNTIIGAKFGSAVVPASSNVDGRIYVLIGNDSSSQHKDHVSFIITKKFNGDADTQGDAGDSFATALAIEPKRYTVNYIGGADKKDTFSFVAKKGEKYQVGYIPGDDLLASIQLNVTDEYKAKIASKTFSTSQGGRTDQFTIPEDGAYYIQLQTSYPVAVSGQYTLELRKIAGAS